MDDILFQCIAGFLSGIGFITISKWFFLKCIWLRDLGDAYINAHKKKEE